MYALFFFESNGFQDFNNPKSEKRERTYFCSKVRDFTMANGKGRIEKEDCLILRTIHHILNGYLFSCIDMMAKSQQEY